MVTNRLYCEGVTVGSVEGEDLKRGAHECFRTAGTEVRL